MATSVDSSKRSKWSRCCGHRSGAEDKTSLRRELLGEGVFGTQDELKAISDRLMATQNQLSGGESRGYVIPFLLWLNKDVATNLDYRLCFWSVFLSSTGFIALFSLWSAPILVLLAGLFATMASFKRPERPDDIPLARDSLDIFLGRSYLASTETPGLHANNNVSITNFKGKYILAYRQSEYHLPSAKSRIVVASSTDIVNWKTEFEYSNGSDLRETILIEMNGQLILYFFSLVPMHNTFKPLHVYYTTSADAKNWSVPVEVCRRGEVPWEIKVYGDKVYKASYLGDHYGTDEVLTLFEESSDGIAWKPVGNSLSSTVYRGGICEVSFEFTPSGDLIAIGRNEDGDATGFGSQLFFAKKESLGNWLALESSIPYRFDSPRMTRTDSGEIILFARYAPLRYQLAPRSFPFMYQKVINLVMYSVLGMKTAAIFRIAPHEEWGKDGNGAVQLIRCFENTFGDCGFFSVARDLSASDDGQKTRDQWVVANYTSTTCQSHAPW
eukprot:CAMPEP_0169076466 /NCGR_PEP_ID=MMETSP1015-20121227/8365_1 /TAXON_ID=342587 /ORGANISM="Karlodinium micrum, Strain CCMP2283" /LENGTH=497 /DNA_ID=CAMNT_0009135935 /DNA_START=8 /DNA_END=1498 /DNA_ORIENTATION=-